MKQADVDDLEQQRAGGNVRPGRSVTLRDHPRQRRSHEERPAGVASRAGTRRVELGQAGLGGSKSRPCLLLSCSSFIQPLGWCGTGEGQALGALPIPGREAQRRFRLSSGALQLRQISGRTRQRQEPGQHLPLRHRGAKRRVLGSDEPAIDRREHVGRAARSRRDARRHADGILDRIGGHDRRAEIQTPLLFLEETDAGRAFWFGRDRLRRIHVRVDGHAVDTMNVAQPSSVQLDHERTLPRSRGSHVDSKDAGARRCIRRKYFRCHAVAFQPDFDPAVEQWFERIEARQVNRKA